MRRPVLFAAFALVGCTQARPPTSIAACEEIAHRLGTGYTCSEPRDQIILEQLGATELSVIAGPTKAGIASVAFYGGAGALSDSLKSTAGIPTLSNEPALVAVRHERGALTDEQIQTMTSLVMRWRLR
jgi:hypothetical protein